MFGSCCWIYAPLKWQQFRAIRTECGEVSFTPKFYYCFMTTELDCLLFQGNSRTPKKTWYFHQVTELLHDSFSEPLDSHGFMELLIASPNISQAEQTSLSERNISVDVNDLFITGSIWHERRTRHEQSALKSLSTAGFHHHTPPLSVFPALNRVIR